jgi:hypothetical protein
VISQHKVKVMFTAPTAFRAIKKEDPTGALIKNYDLSNFKALFWRASDAILATSSLPGRERHWPPISIACATIHSLLLFSRTSVTIIHRKPTFAWCIRPTSPR